MKSAGEKIKEKYSTITRLEQTIEEFKTSSNEKKLNKINWYYDRIDENVFYIKNKMRIPEFYTLKDGIEIDLNNIAEETSFLYTHTPIGCCCVYYNNTQYDYVDDLTNTNNINMEGIILSTKTSVEDYFDMCRFDETESSDLLYVNCNGRFALEKIEIDQSIDFKIVKRMLLNNEVLFCLQNGRLRAYNFDANNLAINFVLATCDVQNIVWFDVLHDKVIISDGNLLYLYTYTENNFTQTTRTEQPIKNFACEVFFLGKNEIVARTVVGRYNIFDGNLKYKETLQQKLGGCYTKAWNGFLFYKFYDKEEFGVSCRKDEVENCKRAIVPFCVGTSVHIEFLHNVNAFRIGTKTPLTFTSNKHFTVLDACIKNDELVVVLETGHIFKVKIMLSLEEILKNKK